MAPGSRGGSNALLACIALGVYGCTCLAASRCAVIQDVSAARQSLYLRPERVPAAVSLARRTAALQWDPCTSPTHVATGRGGAARPPGREPAGRTHSLPKHPPAMPVLHWPGGCGEVSRPGGRR